MAITDVATLGIQVTTAGVNDAKRSLDDLAASGDKAAASTANLNKSFSQGTGPGARQASANYREQRDALAKLAGQIDPTIAALGRLDAQQAKLAAFKKSGLLGADDFNALNAAIEANRAKLTTAGNAMSHFSLNTSLARREIGRLGTDIVNGNWGRFEQTSLTLANYSGILGAAFTGVGAAVLGTVAALGLGIVAFQKGSSEAENFNKQLILTGNIAGVSAGQLADMAKSIAASTGSTQHAASATLAEVAGTGKFVGTQLQLVAAAAQDLQDTTGQAIKETIKQFVSLADDPANAIVKLNDQQHFLTLSIYDQIKALQDQGQEQAASDLAMQTYAETIASRTPKITENLGLIEKAWKGIKDAAATAADAAMGIGRAQTDQQKFDVLFENRQSAKSLIDRGMGNDNFLGTTAQKYFDNATAQLAKMQDERKQQDEQAAAQANQQSAQDAGIKLSREADAYASAEVKRARLIAKAHGDANDAIAKAEKVQDADLRLKLIAQAKANEAAVIAGIESHAKKPPKPKADPFNSLNHLVQGAQVADENFGAPNKQAQQVKDILAIVDAGAKLIEQGQSVAKVQGLVAQGVAAVNDRYAKQATQLQQQNIVAVQKYQVALDQENDALQRGIDSQIAKVSMGDKEYQREEQLNQIYQKNAEAIARLAVERAKLVAGGKDTGAVDGEIAAQQENTSTQVQIVKNGYVQMDAAQATWEFGAIRALANVGDEGQNVAGLTANVFTSAFNTMGDAIATFVTTGKLNFTGLVSSILTDIARMEARILESKVASSILGSFLGSSGGNGAMATSFDSNGTFFSPYANGGVFQNSPSLSAYSGSVVSSPTPFMFAAGAGIMGEAGPEAILPLRRGPDGKLGVASGGSGGAPTVNLSIAIDNSGNATQQSSGDANATAAQFADRMKAMSRQTIAEEQRPGGLLWRMAHA